MGYLHIEFHSRQHDSHHSGAAREVHACLLRVWQYETVQKLEETGGLKALGETLAQFAYLETVVLETSHEFDIDEVPSLLESLRSTCRADVQHRTCEDAHKLALQAKDSPSRSTGGGLLSPFWCGQGVDTNEWQFL